MKTALPVLDYELLLDCVHCGLCTNFCPTYVENGHEADSPRGRIHLMRAVIDGRLDIDREVTEHLDLCLNCRACETACPSGVQYGKLIEPFRLHLEKLQPNRAKLPWLQRQILYRIFPSRRLTKLALLPVRVAQKLGMAKLLDRATKLLPGWVSSMQGMLPKLAPHYGSLPEVLPAEGKQRARVGLFLGCVADGVYPGTNLATARVLQKNGCEVHIPRRQQCCGALHYHSAIEDKAIAFGRANVAAFDLSKLDAIVTNAAGCGAMLKDYAHLLHDSSDAAQFQAKVRDVSEFLWELGPVPPTHPLNLTATYHDACHLCHAQKVREQPRQLLGLIPGLKLVPLNESELCCGAAGSYNLTQPTMAEQLGRRKVDNIRATGATAVFTGNVGCSLQIARHLREVAPDLWVAHPIDALWASYTGTEPTPGVIS